MNKINKKPYNLLHITSRENSKKILENGFVTSIHNLEKCKNQWLGDGVYFWDGNDDNIVEFGKTMLKNKFKTEDMVELYGVLEIERDKHVNLEEKEAMQSFCSFVKKINPTKAEQMLELISLLKRKFKVNPKKLAEVGKFLGTMINLYIEVLEKNGCSVDMVSCYFFHGKDNLKIFGRKEKSRRQYCIKNIEMLNNNIMNFKVYD